MKLNRLLVGIICASMAVAQLPVSVFAETADFDEGSEVVVVEEEHSEYVQNEYDDSVDTVSDEETAVSSDSLLGTGDSSYTWEGFSYYYDSNTKTLTVEGEGEYPGRYLLHNDYVDGIISNVDKIVLNTRGALSAYQLFVELKNVKEIDLSGFDSGNVTNMGEMFNECRSLKKVDLSGLDTRKVTNMYWMFWGCESLESVDVTGFNTSNVTNMEGMFCQCSSLKALDLSGFDTSGVTNMWDMFRDCRGLTTLNVSGFDTSKVTNMGCMFEYCENLTSLDVSIFNTGNVTNMQDMFKGCKSLKTLKLRGFDTKNVTNMAGMFGICASLENLSLPAFDVSKVEDMTSMFAACSSLKTLDLSTWNVSNVKSLKNIVINCNNLQNFKTPYNNTEVYTLPVTMTDESGKQYVKGKTPVKTTVSLTLKASGQQDDPDDENYDHKLTLSNSSDYNSVHVYAYNGNTVVHHKDVKKGGSFGFNNGNHLVITGLGLGDGMDKTPFTYFIRFAFGDQECLCDGYSHDGEMCDLGYPTGDFELLAQGRHIPVSAITAKGRVPGDYAITTTVASKKGNYISIPKNGAPVKVTFAAKKTGSVNYEIANPTATVAFGSGNPEEIALSEEKNKYYYEMQFVDLARLAYSEENPSVVFTVNAAAKLPAPTAKVSTSTDIDATLTLGLPKAASGLTGLWYKVEGKANVAKGKSLPEGMTGSVGPLYVPATVTTLPVYLMAEEGEEYGNGVAQKYDFTATLLRLETEPVYTDKPLTDKTAVEGADGGNVVGVSPEKKVSGSTKKPGYEEKLGLKKIKPAFILGEDEVTLATAKYSAKTTFKELELAEIKDDVSGAVVRASDTEDESEMITIDGDTIILEDSAGLTPGGKYTLSVWPKSKTGGKNAKPATLKLTVKQGIDELSLTVPQQSYVKKAKKAITIKPSIKYNGGDSKKSPAVKKVNWELLDADGNKLTDASPLFGKVTINKKNGTVTVAKDLVISGDPDDYRFKIMATAADYEDNATAAKTDVIELVSDETKTDIQPVEMEIQIDNTSEITESDIHFFSGVISKSDGKRYVNGEELALRIADGTHSEKWVVSLEEGFNLVVVPNFGRQGEEEYRWFRSEDVRKLMKAGKKLTLKIVPNN